MSDDFAVIQINSRQYLVSEGSTFEVDQIDSDYPVEVLAAGIGGKYLIGTPDLKDMIVPVEIVENKKSDKVHVRRYKSKSRYRKNKGHRQQVSVIKVGKIKHGT